MPEPTAAELEAMAKQLGGKAGGLGGAMPPGFASSLGAKLPPNLPGLGAGGRLPGLGGGFNPFGGKKK